GRVRCHDEPPLSRTLYDSARSHRHHAAFTAPVTYSRPDRGSAPRRAAMSVTRRQFLRTTGLGVAAVGALGGCATALKGDFAPKSGKRVVVIGGGWGGATAAKYVRLGDPSIEVILLEPNKTF